MQNFFGDEETYGAILSARCPSQAKTLGRRVRGFDQGQWIAHRFQIAVRGNAAKFGQNPELKAWLLATGDSVLVKASPVDMIWGPPFNCQIWDQCRWSPERRPLISPGRPLGSPHSHRGAPLSEPLVCVALFDAIVAQIEDDVRRAGARLDHGPALRRLPCAGCLPSPTRQSPQCGVSMGHLDALYFPFHRVQPY